MDTKDVIARYYELANAGEWNAWSDLFATDQSMDEQLAGHIEGRETLRGMVVEGFPKMYRSFQNQPRLIVVDGEQAAVVSHISARTLAGESVEADVANYFRVVDGQIAYMANFHDTVPFRPVTGNGG
jgi:ketosteroid isomerase-like protein